MTSKAVPAEVRAEIIKDFIGGDLMEDIAARHGVHRNTIKRFVKEAGIPPRPQGGDSTLLPTKYSYRPGWVRVGMTWRLEKSVNQKREEVKREQR